MKIVLYNNNEQKIIDVMENVIDVEVSGNSVKCNKGEIRGIKHDFAVINDTDDENDFTLLSAFDPSNFKTEKQIEKERIDEIQKMVNYILFNK